MPYIKRISLLAVASILLLLATLVPSKQVRAAFLSERSVAIATSVPSAITAYTFSFTYGSTSNVGSMIMEFCSNSALFDDPCTAPVGLDVSSAVLTTQTGNTGYSIDAGLSTATKVVLTRPVQSASPVASSYVFDSIQNPSTPNQSVFVRIATYESTDVTGVYTDRGAVAYTTQNTFAVGAYVPPFLRFCVGITISLNCSQSSGSSLNLGSLKSNQANYGTSQFSVATNDPGGYSVYVHGNTMTAGNNVIPALATATASVPGIGQFGINLRQNSIPAVGGKPSGSGIGTAMGDYALVNQYVFRDGDLIANAAGVTDYSLMTVTYVVNIPNSQAPGRYAATVTYIAVAQF